MALCLFLKKKLSPRQASNRPVVCLESAHSYWRREQPLNSVEKLTIRIHSYASILRIHKKLVTVKA